MSRSMLIAALLFPLAACSGPTAADAAKPTEATAAPVKQKTVFDDQLKALDKAKAVEKQMQEDKEKQDKAIEDQGG